MEKRLDRECHAVRTERLCHDRATDQGRRIRKSLWLQNAEITLSEEEKRLAAQNNGQEPEIRTEPVLKTEQTALNFGS